MEQVSSRKAALAPCVSQCLYGDVVCIISAGGMGGTHILEIGLESFYLDGDVGLGE